MFLYAFDLIELNGDDLRRDPLVVRKATLASVLAKAAVGIRFNEHMEFDDGEVVFYHACKLGLEGIVSKRKDSTYRSGRSPDWLKMKNLACEAVKREAEVDWRRQIHGPLNSAEPRYAEEDRSNQIDGQQREPIGSSRARVFRSASNKRRKRLVRFQKAEIDKW